MYANGNLINSIGLFAGAVGYACKLSGGEFKYSSRLSHCHQHEVAERLFRIILLIGSALMFFAYWKLGVMDFISEPDKWPFMRYITGDIIGGSASEEWLVNRAMDLLTVSLPFVLIGAVKHPKVLRILPAFIGYAALLIATSPGKPACGHFDLSDSSGNRAEQYVPPHSQSAGDHGRYLHSSRNAFSCLEYLPPMSAPVKS